MDKVIIKNLLARGIIGVNDWERRRAQNILINITLYADTRRAGDILSNAMQFLPMSCIPALALRLPYFHGGGTSAEDLACNRYRLRGLRRRPIARCCPKNRDGAGD